MAYANGLIPLSALTALSTGGHLLAPSAAAFEVWRIQAARAGYDLRPTSASDTFRPYDVQERIFRDRYRPGNLAGRPGFTRDVRYWPGHGYWTRRTGTAAAAVPGTSNHGKAVAVDIRNAGAFGGPFHAWMSRTGPALGWSNTEGRSVGEPWHWVHSGAHLVDNPISGGGSVTIPTIPGAPAPITPEDDMPTAQEVAAALLETRIAIGGGQTVLVREALAHATVVKQGMFDGGSSMPGGQPLKDRLETHFNQVYKGLSSVSATAAEARDIAAKAVEQTGPIIRTAGPVSLRQEVANTLNAVLAFKPAGAAEVDIPALADALKGALTTEWRRDLIARLSED